MRILPILFNTEMVKAILEGRKTVTRRCVKLPKWIEKQNDGTYTMFAECTCYEKQRFGDIAPYLNKPYRPGDILYVRESVFQGVGHYLDVSGETISVLTNDFEYYADGLHKKDHWKDKYERTWMHRRPSIHMPKEAARIWLKVKDVRVERLQDIKNLREEGIIPAESCEHCFAVCGGCDPKNSPTGCDNEVENFADIWDSTIKKSDLDSYGWEANPWVWVIEFERCEKPKGVCKLLLEKNSFPKIEFSVKYKETGLPVNIEEMAEEEWAKDLIQCDMEGLFIGEDGQLILSDECGNFAYVPREGKYLVTLFVGEDMYETEW